MEYGKQSNAYTADRIMNSVLYDDLPGGKQEISGVWRANQLGGIEKDQVLGEAFCSQTKC